MSVSKDVKKYVDETVKTIGEVDMFYNNAGISGPGIRFADNTIEEIEQSGPLLNTFIEFLHLPVESPRL